MKRWETLADYEITGEIAVSCPKAAAGIAGWLEEEGEFFDLWQNRYEWPQYRPGEFIFEGLDEEPARHILEAFPDVARQPVYRL